MLLLNRHRIPVWGDEKVLELGGGDGCTILGMYLMPRFVHSKVGDGPPGRPRVRTPSFHCRVPGSTPG